LRRCGSGGRCICVTGASWWRCWSAGLNGRRGWRRGRWGRWRLGWGCRCLV